MTYQVRYADSGTRNTHDSYQQAIAEIIGSWPHAFTHQCDGRTLVWENEAASENDDGTDAVAEIIETLEAIQ